MLTVLYILGIAGFMVPMMNYLVDLYDEIPSFPTFLLACVTWPVMLPVALLNSLFNRIDGATSWDREIRRIKKVHKNDIAPVKDPYLIEAEKEVDAFLEYKDVPESETVKAFNDISVQGVENIRVIYPWKHGVSSVCKSVKTKRMKAYNKYLSDIEDEKIEYVKLYERKNKYKEYSTTYSYYGDY